MLGTLKNVKVPPREISLSAGLWNALYDDNKAYGRMTSPEKANAVVSRILAKTSGAAP
jgi:hypothetical protein